MKTPKIILTTTMLAILAACGGGGGSSDTTQVPPVDLITAASTAVATSIGATLIAGASSDEELYNITADIGDSWQLVLNNKLGTYVIKVLNTQYDLVSSVPAVFTKTPVGTLTTVKSATGTALSVQIDTRTKTLVGNVTLGSKTATVSGSGYAVADTTKLAGNYFFLGATRNVLNGQFRDHPAGSFIVSANGTDITVCDEAIVVNGACAAIPGVGSQTINSKLLKVSKDSAGLLRLKDGTKDFGVLHVSAGDRGPVLILDRFGYNDENVLRAGVIFAGKTGKLAGTEFNGNATCSVGGSDTVDVVVTGNSYTFKELGTTNNGSGTLQYNKAYSDSGVLFDLNNVVSVQDKNETLSQSRLLLPLSSSLAVIAENDGGLAVCRRTS
jgi:hypothetical protein